VGFSTGRRTATFGKSEIFKGQPWEKSAALSGLQQQHMGFAMLLAPDTCRIPAMADCIQHVPPQA
jgi:hypothetical protein